MPLGGIHSQSFDVRKIGTICEDDDRVQTVGRYIRYSLDERKRCFEHV
jgi:hypothetical protein